MMLNRKAFEEFERNLICSTKPDLARNLRIMDAMYEQAKKMGALHRSDPLAGIEAVVKMARVAGRPRDLDDVKSIILKNPGYDKQYIKRWLQEFDRSLGENYIAVFRSILDDLR